MWYTYLNSISETSWLDSYRNFVKKKWIRQFYPLSMLRSLEVYHAPVSVIPTGALTFVVGKKFPQPTVKAPVTFTLSWLRKSDL